MIVAHALTVVIAIMIATDTTMTVRADHMRHAGIMNVDATPEAMGRRIMIMTIAASSAAQATRSVPGSAMRRPNAGANSTRVMTNAMNIRRRAAAMIPATAIGATARLPRSIATMTNIVVKISRASTASSDHGAIVGAISVVRCSG